MPITHEWNGTVLTITSDSGTSSADLKGAKGDDGARGAQGVAGANIAEDTAKLGGIKAENYATKDYVDISVSNIDFTPYATKDYVEKKVSAYNLLDNSWFGGRYIDGVKEGLVYQAGINGKHGGTKYPMDRWISWDKDVVFADGYITTGSPIDQRIDAKRIDTSKTYTIAICLADGAIRCASGTPTTNFGSYALGIYALAMTNTNFWIVRLNSNNNIRWVALYEGEYTAENLPPYVPKGYGAELAECQRYYRRIEHTGNMVLFSAIAYNTKSLYGVLPFGFRVKPTININNIVFCKTGITTAKTIVSITTTTTTGGITPIMLTVNDGDATTGDVYNVWTSTNGGYMELSADL